MTYKVKYSLVRKAYFFVFLICAAILAFSFYLQVEGDLQPCPLCILQRIILIIVALIFFTGFAHKFHRLGLNVIAILAFLFSLSGAIFSGRQVWLQHVPDNTLQDCAANLQYMLTVLPFDQVIKNIFQGSAECAQITWYFLGLSLAEWSCIWFILFMMFCMWQIERINRTFWH